MKLTDYGKWTHVVQMSRTSLGERHWFTNHSNVLFDYYVVGHITAPAYSEVGYFEYGCRTSWSRYYARSGLIQL